MDLTLNEGEICRLVQDDKRGEPMVLLRRTPESATEVLTVEQAWKVRNTASIPHPESEDEPCWFCELGYLLEGIR